jgi:hypothetical protein
MAIASGTELAVLGWFIGILTSMVAFASSSVWLRWMHAQQEWVSVEVDGTTVRAGDRVLSGITRGDSAQMLDGAWRVDLHAPLRQRLRIVVPTAEDARALLGALGLDRRDGTSRLLVRWARPAHAFEMFLPVLLTPICCALLTPHDLSFPWEMIFAGYVYGAVRNLVTRGTVSVGVDGVHVDRGVFGKRFVPHAEIVDVTRTKTGVELVLSSNETLRLHTWRERERTGNWLTDPVYDAIDAALRQARYARSAGGAAVAALARGGRSTRDWIAALRELGARRQGGYRAVPIEDRDLLAMVADAQAPAELRAAAAVALGANEEQAPKLRVAADDVADPAVRRVALATTESEAALEEALDEASAVEPRRMRA